jgi:tetratricopeptide (TPR) repeat protein
VAVTDSLEREVRELRSFYWSERDPDGRGFAPLADAYRRSGDLEGARELLAEGLERHPEFASGHVVAARVYLAEGDREAAVGALNRVLELDDENTEALWILGSLHEEGGDRASAFDLLKRLTVLVPDDDEVLDRIRALESELESGEGWESGVEGELAAGAVDSAESDVLASDAGAESSRDVVAALESEELGEDSWDFATADRTMAEVPDEEELYTRTLAELYADQGLFDRAADVYRHLIAADPDDTELQARLEAVEGRILPATPGDEAALVEQTDVTDLDEIAAELATGPAVAGDLDTPFAWSEAAAPPEPEEEGLPIADHFSDLLSWPAPDVAEAADEEAPVPGAGIVEEVEPASEPVPIDALAPEGSSPAAEAAGAEEPVPVAFLAPDAAQEEVVPIDALAPEEVASAEDEEVSDQVAKFRDWMRRLGK